MGFPIFTIAGSAIGSYFGGAGGASAGRAIGSAIDSSNSAKESADQLSAGANAAAAAQVASQERAIEEYKNQLQYGKDTLQPFRDIGVKGVGYLDKLMTPGNQQSFLESTPGYQFSLDQGLKAIQRGATARGGLNSGATLRALSDYGQNTANSTYTDTFNKYMQFANMGYSTSRDLASLGADYAKNYHRAQDNIGIAQAGGIIGSANSQAASTIAANNLMAQALADGYNSKQGSNNGGGGIMSMFGGGGGVGSSGGGFDASMLGGGIGGGTSGFMTA